MIRDDVTVIKLTHGTQNVVPTCLLFWNWVPAARFNILPSCRLLNPYQRSSIVTKIVFITLFVFVQDKPKHPTNDGFRRMLVKCIWRIWVCLDTDMQFDRVREYDLSRVRVRIAQLLSAQSLTKHWKVPYRFCFVCSCYVTFHLVALFLVCLWIKYMYIFNITCYSFAVQRVAYTTKTYYDNAIGLQACSCH